MPQTTMDLRRALLEVGEAVRRPEQLARRWRDAETAGTKMLIVVLLANAAFGIWAYGLTMGMSHGLPAMLRTGFGAALAAGGAWSIALPALYIFNNAFGSHLDIRATLLAASVAVCFGGWAMLASVPVSWFFVLSIPPDAHVLIDVIVFAGVGFCMTDVFLRVMKALEPERTIAVGLLWLGLLGTLGIELFVLLDVF